MRDLLTPSRPFGYFVHHKGRGHAERCATLVNALPASRPVTIFCARPDILPPLPGHARIIAIPSLFERRGSETDMDQLPTPVTLHCAPLGWPGIREAMGIIAGWFSTSDPALMICDVSAEIAQLSRICSVPHVKVLQHGDRGDPGHRAAYDGAAGLLAPFSHGLAQPDWTKAMQSKTHFAAGLGALTDLPLREEARLWLGLPADARVALILSGGGGDGFPLAPFGIAARALPDWHWLTIGHIKDEWHATAGANLDHRGWVDNPLDYLAAADLVISSAGNTTCAQVLAMGRPWIVVPEWRYFDEQLEKACALSRANAALFLPRLPASAHRWTEAVEAALNGHDSAAQARLLSPHPARNAADWLEGLAARIWQIPSLKLEA